MVPKPINCGKSWSSFDNDLTSHYNQYEYLISMRESKRCSAESGVMDELQNDPRDFPRYYACDAKWVDKWLQYMQQTDATPTKREPPGPIDNRSIAKQLTEQKRERDSEATGTYFNLSKHLWCFF